MKAIKKKPNRDRIRVHSSKPNLMREVDHRVDEHFQGKLVERIRASGGKLAKGKTTVILADEFGFCYGVRRAIDLAYAARFEFPDRRIFLIGEIIHNQEVNKRIGNMGVHVISAEANSPDYDEIGVKDVVIVPAFGATSELMDKLKTLACVVVDATCGDVMTVWRRVRNNARRGFTSIIHGKANHEETQATVSRATANNGHYLVVFDVAACKRVCHYIENGGDKAEFLHSFHGAYSKNFDPDLHLQKIGVANQTTMLKGETERIQGMLEKAVIKRDGEESAVKNFANFDTICGATQVRQDALFKMLEQKLDMLIVVGGYNSSNTTHLVEIGLQKTPTFFIRSSNCVENFAKIYHYDIEQKREIATCAPKFSKQDKVVIGVTAGASCPDNLVEETIKKIFALREQN